MGIDITAVSALLKTRYGDDFFAIRGPEQKVQEAFKFKANEIHGAKFAQAARFSEEQGFHIRAAGSAAPTMNAAIALKVESIEIVGSILDFRSQIDLEVMARAQTNAQAFEDSVGLRLGAMRDAMYRHNESSQLYGGMPLAKIGSIAGSSTSRTWTLTKDTAAPGWWFASKNMPVDIYSDAALTTKINTNADVLITKFTRVAGGSHTLDVTGNATDLTNSLVTHYIVRKGESSTTISPGIVAQLNATSGTVNNIALATYPEFGGSQVNVAGQISMAKVLYGAALCADAGMPKTASKLWLSPLNFAVLNADLAANRRYDGSYERTKGTNGFGAIAYYGPTGVIEVEVHTYLQGQHAVLLQPETWSRRGASDVTFTIPRTEQEMMVLSATSQSYDYRAFSLQGMLCMKPAQNCLFYGITTPTV